MRFDEARAVEVTIVYCPVCLTNDEVVDVAAEVLCCNNCSTRYSFGPEVEPGEVTDAEFPGAFVFCPRCCTATDADGYGVGEVTCEDCGTGFAVELDPDVVAEHARYG